MHRRGCAGEEAAGEEAIGVEACAGAEAYILPFLETVSEAGQRFQKIRRKHEGT